MPLLSVFPLALTNTLETGTQEVYIVVAIARALVQDIGLHELNLKQKVVHRY